MNPDPDRGTLDGGDKEIAVRVAGWLRVDDAVPASAVSAAKAGFRWRAIDDELAELAYDSSDDLLGLTNVRGASTRQLCFAAHAVSMEIELRDEAQLLVGQLIPTGPAEIELVALARPGVTRRELADEVGRFAIDEVPAGPIRLRWTGASGRRLATDWFRA
jgi:hypothetical protein